MLLAQKKITQPYFVWSFEAIVLNMLALVLSTKGLATTVLMYKLFLLKSLETSCQTQLFCKTGLRSRRSYLTNVPSRASGNTEVAREPGDIQLGKKDRTGNVRALSSLNTCCFFYQSDVLWCNPNCCCMEFSFVIQFYLRHLQAITVILNAMERIQSNMSSWPLTSPEDEGTANRNCSVQSVGNCSFLNKGVASC